MQVEFLYSEDCPSHDEALARLRQVLRDEAVEADIRVVRVETDEDARRLRFMGSPTILVDGKDIDPPPRPQYALTCRAYRLDDGRISPLPPPELIRRAVRQAKMRKEG